MNFTDSPYERMMKQIPRPGGGGADPCDGCTYEKKCKHQNEKCRKKFRTLIVEPRRASGQVGPKR